MTEASTARVERAAQRLLAEQGISRPPVPVERLARDLGADIRYQAFDGDVSGLLYREGDVRIIGVNSAHSKTRQRFTVAHELGHLILHRGRPLIVDKQVRVNLRDGVSSLATDREEIQANRFAAALLMPSEWVERLALAVVTKHRSLSDEELVGQLADRFRVSGQAMSYRLVNLGLRSPAD